MLWEQHREPHSEVLPRTLNIYSHLRIYNGLIHCRPDLKSQTLGCQSPKPLGHYSSSFMYQWNQARQALVILRSKPKQIHFFVIFFPASGTVQRPLRVLNKPSLLIQKEDVVPKPLVLSALSPVDWPHLPMWRHISTSLHSPPKSQQPLLSKCKLLLFVSVAMSSFWDAGI